jgi:hypothetical protein
METNTFADNNELIITAAHRGEINVIEELIRLETDINTKNKKALHHLLQQVIIISMTL